MEPTQKPCEKEITSLAKMLSIQMIFLRIWIYLDFQDILTCSLVNKWWFYESREFMYKYRLCFIANRSIPNTCRCLSLKTLNDLLHSRIPDSVLPFNSDRLTKLFCICKRKNFPGPLELFPMIFSELSIKRVELCPLLPSSRPIGLFCFTPREQCVLQLVQRNWDTLETLVLGHPTLSPEDLGFCSQIRQGQSEPSAGPWDNSNNMAETNNIAASVIFPKLKVIDLYHPPYPGSKTLRFFLNAAPNLQKIQGKISRHVFDSMLTKNDYRLLRGIEFNSQAVDSVIWRNLVEGRSELSYLILFHWIKRPEARIKVAQEAVQIDSGLLVALLNNSYTSLLGLECTVSQLLLLTSSDSLVPLVSVSELTLTSGEDKHRWKMYSLFLTSIDFARIFPCLTVLRVLDGPRCSVTNESIVDALRLKSGLTKSDHVSSSVKTVRWARTSLPKGIRHIMKVFPAVERLAIGCQELFFLKTEFNETFDWNLKTLLVDSVHHPEYSIWDGPFSCLKPGLQEMKVSFHGLATDTPQHKWTRNKNGELIVPFISCHGLELIRARHPGLIINIGSNLPFADESFRHLRGCVQVSTEPVTKSLLQWESHVKYLYQLQFALPCQVHTQKE